jgi:hypothetical protein
MLIDPPFASRNELYGRPGLVTAPALPRCTRFMAVRTTTAKSTANATRRQKSECSKSLSAEKLDKLTRSTTCAQVADWLNAYVVAQHPEWEALREKWMMAKDRWAARLAPVIHSRASAGRGRHG